jgi:hypothetical protein
MTPTIEGARGATEDRRRGSGGAVSAAGCWAGPEGRPTLEEDEEAAGDSDSESVRWDTWRIAAGSRAAVAA